MKPSRFLQTAILSVLLLCPLSRIRADDAATNHWVSSVAAGLTLTSGNANNLLATLVGATDRKWGPNAVNEYTLGADLAYGTSKIPPATSNTVTANLIHGFMQYNRLFTERFYGFARLEGRHDAVADLQYRITTSGGVGEYLIKNTNTDLSLEAGPGYVVQEQAGVYGNYMTVRFGQKFHQVLSDRARLWETAEYAPQVNDFNNYVVNVVVGIDADLTKDKRFSLQSYVTDCYTSEPAPGKKHADLTWVTAIAYKF
jgi:putative salt-induced outer membrane protein